MPSERRRSPLVRLADVVAEAGGGVRPTALELAELLWLARHMSPEEPTPEAPAEAEDVRPPEPPHVEQRHEEPPASAPPPPPPESPRAPLHLPAPAPAPQPSPEPHAELLAPAPPMLRHPLALQRSLRPLKRRAAAPHRVELDERATADRIARLGAAPEFWLPVLRPAQERWLRLNLLYDTGPTMPVWRPLIRELHTTLAQSGIFRTVTAHRAEPDGTVRHPDAHAPADGRTVTLLISDCMGPQWRQGPAGTRWYGTLRRWARRMPLAVVQPLPEHLWRDTALPTVPGRLSAPHPAAPNSAISFRPYDDVVEESFVPLPVLEPGPRWLANWAALVAAPGGQEFPGAAAWLRGPGDAVGRADFGELSAEELVLRFRASASPEAFRLAGHLALGRPDLPVMRLVQAALEREPRPQHLAEVILSGMLTGVAGPTGSYAFRSGVRELLLRSLPRTARRRTTDLLSRLGALIDERAGVAAGEIRATTPSASGKVTATGGEPIATVARETRDRLVGRRGALRERYRLLQPVGQGGSLWLGEDTETGERVVVSRVPAPRDPKRARDFLRAGQALKALRHPNVVTVHDYGLELGHQYVVMEYIDGITLKSLPAPGGYRLPAPLLVLTASQLGKAVTALHEAGVPHGRLGMNRVMLLPDGRVKLTLLTLASATGPEPYAWDLRELGGMILRLSSGGAPVTGTTVAPAQLGLLPSSLRPSFARAIGLLLMSEDLTEQQEGLRALRRDAFVRQAWKAHDHIDYSLLGRVTARRGSGQPIATGSPQEQAMLAMLLLHHGRRVTHSQLTEGIWGARAPEGDAEALLRTYASRLRNALGPGIFAALPDGYALHTSADFVDVVTCQKLVEQAEQQRATGELASARTTVDEALSLWRGEALDGVPGPAAAEARTRFHQLRLSLYATRAELDLELGEFERAATELADLLHAHPSREDFRRLYLIALQRQGRTEEALDVFEEYKISGGDNPELLALGHELREAFAEVPEAHPEEPVYEDPPLLEEDEPDRLLVAAEDDDADDEVEADQHDFVRFEFVDGRHGNEAMAALRRLVEELVAASGLARDEYQLVQSAWGVTARMEPYVDGAPLFRATMEGLAGQLRRLGSRRLGATFWQAHLRPDGTEVHSDRPDFGAAKAVLNESGAQAIVALSEFWHFMEDVDSETVDPLMFRQFGNGGGWYRVFDQGDDMSPPAEERPVRGPFPMPYDGRIPQPRDPDLVIVLSTTDGLLAVPDSPSVQQPSHVRAGWHYFEVDLRERHLSVTGVPGVSVTWRVDDPLKAAASPGLDLPGMLTDVLAGARRRGRDGLDAALAQWSVPGYALHWTVPPELRSPAALPAGARRSVGELIRTARYVLLGFDEVLARMYTQDAEREVLRDVARLLVEERDPEDALSGRPLLATGGPVSSVEGYANSLDLLRAFAGHRMEREVRALVDSHDNRAARTARPTPLAADLLKALDGIRARPIVVTDRTAGAVARYLRQHRLIDHVLGGVYGRPLDLSRLMPHPHVLLEALDHVRAPASACVLVASTVAELSAARTLGLPFIGYAPNDAARRRLRAADEEVLLVPSLSPLLEAARAR
ncbi:SAV_2336 N-terminal domain-related protein [Streptomyces cupreus]|uniref:Winged helix-turn-helix domain-containing protein n=1 Tax=Streptomyces cupreus TaxID=2759956 RepID=A0A7X1IZS2_9ACTN|nr:SAV_2336 N-terminal domain-related protein [Streptomyces cupreus]MBC2901556.1 winged helix-turn-helix domain-containing protein [Streptomyces cupreus]